MSEQILMKSELLGEQYLAVRHKSGLPIYIFPKNMSVTHAVFAVRYGSADNLDENGQRPFPDGIAHFLEHKLFSNEDGSDSFERFSALGADANAYTSHTRTVYLFSATDRFYEALAELADFVTHPFFTKESVKKEQGIIGEEIRMCRDNPYDVCYYNMLDGLYRAHPVRDEICGSLRSIAKITDKTLYDCYHRYYTPENMALVVCGDVEVDEVLRTLDEHLSPAWCESKGDGAMSVALLGDVDVHKARVVARGQVAKPVFAIGVKDIAIPADPEARIRRDAMMAILSEMLFSQAGELYNRLFDAGMISPEFSADFALTCSFGFLQISGEADDPDAVLSEIRSYLDELRQKGLSREDFERARRVEFAEYIKGFDSTEEIANTLLSFAFDDAEIFAYARVLQDVTLEEITALFEGFFGPERTTISIVFPNE